MKFYFTVNRHNTNMYLQNVGTAEQLSMNAFCRVKSYISIRLIYLKNELYVRGFTIWSSIHNEKSKYCMRESYHYIKLSYDNFYKIVFILAKLKKDIWHWKTWVFKIIIAWCSFVWAYLLFNRLTFFGSSRYS